MNRKAALLQNTLIFAIGNFGSKVLVLLLLPFCTFYIDPSGMGTYDLIYSVVEVLKPIAMLALPESLYRWLLDDNQNKGETIATWLRLFVCALLISSVVFWAAWSYFLFENSVIIYLMIITGCIYMAFQFLTRGFHNNKLFAVQGIVYSVVLCAASLCFVMLLNMGYIGLLLGVLAGNISATVIMIVCQIDQLTFTGCASNKLQQREMFRYSAFMLPNTICWWLVNSLGRVVVTIFLGVSQNGIFAIAARFPLALNMLSTIFQQAWTEQAVGEYESKDRNSYFSDIFQIYSRLMLGLTIVLIPFTKIFILLFMDVSYVDAIEYIGLLYVASVLCSFSSFFGTNYVCGKDTKGAASSTLVGGLISVVLSIALVNVLGIIGVSIGMVVSQAVIWALRIRQTKMEFSITISWRTILFCLVICFSLSFLLPILGLTETWALLLLACVFFLILNISTLSQLFKKVVGRINSGKN